MVKISFIASGIILGLATISSASASLISRSFLDQALTDYATNTALDLKANQSDFTDLNTQIKDSVILLRELWNEDSYWFLYATNPEHYSENIIGAFSLLEKYLHRLTYGLVRGWADTDGTSYMGLVELNNGWTDSKGNTYLGVKGLNDKIGTLPEGTIDIGTQGLNEMFGKEKSFPVTIPSDYTLSDAFQNLFYSGGVFPSFVDIAAYTMFGGTLSSYWESVLGIKTYKGLLELTKDIGTLPTEYATVGAALTAMDAKIDARELPSASDDGQYVLSAKKVGDTITYTWVKMDLTNEEQAQ